MGTVLTVPQCRERRTCYPPLMQALPSFNLTGQIALVTGAARGLGRAISLALAEAGADVAIGLRDINADQGLAAEITARGRRVLPLQMEMTHLVRFRVAWMRP